MYYTVISTLTTLSKVKVRVKVRVEVRVRKYGEGSNCMSAF